MTRTDISIITVNGKTPRIDPSAFIAPGCRIIGDVTIGPDVSRIVVGARSNIQDGSVVHCDGPMPHRPDGYPTIIGEDVLIGHLAMVHGCVLDDRAFVGLKATVMNGCRIGSDAMLAAGALLTEHKEIPGRELWAGSPARRVREIGDEQAAGMQAGVAHYVLNGRMHKAAGEGE